MRESRTYGSVRGALSNERPYRVRWFAVLRIDAIGTERRFAATDHLVGMSKSGHRQAWR
jgi:hypothetical protein